MFSCTSQCFQWLPVTYSGAELHKIATSREEGKKNVRFNIRRPITTDLILRTDLVFSL